jgi:hypothetical protein
MGNAKYAIIGLVAVSAIAVIAYGLTSSDILLDTSSLTSSFQGKNNDDNKLINTPEESTTATGVKETSTVPYTDVVPFIHKSITLQPEEARKFEIKATNAKHANFVGSINTDGLIKIQLLDKATGRITGYGWDQMYIGKCNNSSCPELRIFSDEHPGSLIIDPNRTLIFNVINFGTPVDIDFDLDIKYTFDRTTTVN